MNKDIFIAFSPSAQKIFVARKDATYIAPGDNVKIASGANAELPLFCAIAVHIAHTISVLTRPIALYEVKMIVEYHRNKIEIYE